MKEKTSSSRGGIGFVGVLTIVFVVLKLLHLIEWSWLWVLSPLWITAVLVGVILLFIGLIIIIDLVIKQIMQKGE